MADLANLKTKDTVVVNLTINGEALMNDPVGKEKPTQMTLTFNHPNSQAYREVEFDLQDIMMEEVKSSKDGEIEMDARKLFDRRLSRLELNSIDWDITRGGVKPEFTQEGVKELLKDVRDFMYQAEEAIDKEAVFTVS